ncbi:MAG: PorT family protein [Dysgonamonadaceae bacterium]|jgi:opacity protein-like surface antigen|nr:PorT family protein [Dysgonamonadaceae bacterium]
MKKTLLLFLGLALTYGLNAQLRYGVKLGGTLSDLSLKSEGESERSDPKIGFQIGGILEYSFSTSFALQPELLYVNNGGKFEDNLSFNLHNLQLPVNIKYKMGTDKLKFYVTAGPYLGYIFAARLKSGPVSIDAFDEAVNTEMQLKHFDFGLGAGFGIEISNKYVVGTGYKYGLANITGAEGVNVKVGTFNLSIGYLF